MKTITSILVVMRARAGSYSVRDFFSKEVFLALTRGIAGARRRFGPYFAKELREIVSGRALWTLLLLPCPLVGYSFFQATSLYGEASEATQVGGIA